MGVTIGPADWWARSAEGIRSLAISCPVGTTLPDGSRIICKAGGTAWIIAPNCTQVTQSWNGTSSALVGTKPCVSDWATLNTALLNNGFNPADWFVPSCTQLSNPGYVCRSQWDTCSGSTIYWSSTEIGCCQAANIFFGSGTQGTGPDCIGKYCVWSVRAMRCVTY